MAQNDDMLEMIQEGLNDNDASSEESLATDDGGHQEANDNQEEVDLSNDTESQEQEQEAEVSQDGKAQPEAGELDVSKLFNGFSSLDEVNAAIQRAQQFTPEVEEELQTLRQGKEKLNTLEETVKSLKERNPFNKKEFYQLDKLSEQDPDKAAILTAYKFGDQSAETTLKLKMQLENPELAKDNPGYFDRALRKKYPALYSDEYTPEDVEYKDALTDMRADANAAGKYLDGELSKVEIPKAKTDEEVQAEQQQFFKNWQPSFKKVASELTKIDIPVFDESKEGEVKVAMSYDIPKEHIKAIQETAANYIGNSHIEPTPENIKMVVNSAKAAYMFDHQAEIYTKFANNLLSEGSEAALKKFNNPAKHGSDVPKPSGGQKPKEASDFIFDDIMTGGHV